MPLSEMKIQSVILLAVVFLVFSRCNKKSEEPYSNVDIVMDNAQAALYFHTVFCEAESAWAFADINEYEEKTDTEGTDLNFKKLTYSHVSETKDSVVIEYQDWELTNHLSLTGKIIVTFDTISYRIDSKTASVLLSDFSINRQTVVGEATIRYRKTSAKPNGQYVYNLLNGAHIREAGTSAMLISCVISNGEYERIEGNDTLDDVWAFSGVMSGTLHDDPNLKYTNTVSATLSIDGKNIDVRTHYTMNCITAYQGLAQIKIAKRPDIFYIYNCSKLEFESTTHNIH